MRWRCALAVEALAPVVVGVDGSPVGLAAVDLAAREASARGAPLLIVHSLSGPRSRGRAGRVESPEAAWRLVRVATRRALSAYPDLPVRAEVVPGEPAAVLVSRSYGASLLVVGHRGRRAAASTAGSVAVRVAGNADLPVIVNRPADGEPAGDGRPVLIGVVGTDQPESVLEFGFEGAALRGVPLVAEHIWCRAADAVPARVGACGLDERQARAEAAEALAETMAVWSAKYPDVVVRQVLRHSLDAAVALTAASRSAGLVVVGSTRSAGSARVAGPVAQALVHRAGCPVAVVPA